MDKSVKSSLSNLHGNSFSTDERLVVEINFISARKILSNVSKLGQKRGVLNALSLTPSA